METLYRVENAELGIASEVRKTLDGSKRVYALYMIDTDADSVVMTQLGDNYDRFVDKADEFAHVTAWASQMYEVVNHKHGRRAVVDEAPTDKYEYRLVMYQDGLSIAVKFGENRHDLEWFADKFIREGKVV